jgi:hypothetical protein
LCRGITLETFKGLGKIPNYTESLIKWRRGTLKASIHIFRIQLGISSKPELLLEPRFGRESFNSDSVHGINKRDFDSGGKTE